MVNNCRKHSIYIVFELRDYDADEIDIGCHNGSANRKEVHLVIRNWQHLLTRIGIPSTII
jgi:hypothetical protein